MVGIQLMGETRRAVLTHLLGSDRAAAELASLCGVNTAAMRRHLDGMEALGLVRSYFVHGGMGRPKKLFAIDDEGRELLGKRYDLVLNLLLDRIVEREGEAKARALLRSLAEDFAAQARREMEGKKGEERIEALVGFFNEMGFPTSLEKRDGRWVIVKRDCILFKVAREHERLVCNEFDNAIIRAAVGDVEVEHGRCLTTGDSVCHQILLPAKRR